MAKFDEEEPVSIDYTDKVRDQVLLIIGKPPRLERVEVCRHHNDNYRVNIWEQPEPTDQFAVVLSPRIRASYYLKVSDVGEIIRSNPPLVKLIE